MGFSLSSIAKTAFKYTVAPLVVVPTEAVINEGKNIYQQASGQAPVRALNTPGGILQISTGQGTPQLPSASSAKTSGGFASSGVGKTLTYVGIGVGVVLVLVVVVKLLGSGARAPAAPAAG